MNGFTFLALIVLGVYCIYVALKYIEGTAIDNARDAGNVKRREHRAMLNRLNKANSYNAKWGW